MAATATTLMEFVRPGQVILNSVPVYGGTDHLLTQILPRFGVEAIGFPAGHGLEALHQALQKIPPGRRLGAVLVETPANPTNALVDIASCRELVDAYRDATGTHEQTIPVIVDNTFLGPLWQQPLKHGADLVLYSATKFIGGHSDLIAGACLGSAALINRVRALRTFLGNMAGPWTGWLLMRSLETLKLRMTCQMKNARYVADYLADHPKVQRVYYLGHLRETDAAWQIYRSQCTAPGSIISFDVVGGEKEAFRLLNGLRLIKLAVSLGGTESLAEHPATMTHADVAPEAQRQVGINSSMIRLSVGIEHPEDLIRDLRQALDQA
jgi:methionine-gamma-lyase